MSSSSSVPAPSKQEEVVPATPPVVPKHPVIVLCSKMYDANKDDNNMLTLQLYDELIALVQEYHDEVVADPKIAEEVKRAWGWAISASMKHLDDPDHAMDLAYDFEDSLNGGQPCTFLRVQCGEGERPAEKLRGYHHQSLGPMDEGCVDGILEYFRGATRTDVAELIANLEVVGIPLTSTVREKLQQTYVFRMKKEDPEDVLEQMKVDNLPPTNPKPFNMVFFKKELTKKTAVDYYEEMLDLGIRPESSTFRLLASRADLSKDHTAMAKTLLKNSKEPIVGAPIARMAALRQLSAKKDVDGALKLLHRMDLEGVIPDKQVLNQLIECARSDPDKAEQIYFDLKERGVKPNMTTFTKLCTIAKENRVRDGVDMWVNEMLDQEIVPDSNVTPTIVDWYLRSGNRARAEQVLVRLIEMNNAFQMFQQMMRFGPFDFALGLLACMVAEDQPLTDVVRDALRSLSRDPLTQQVVDDLEACQWNVDAILTSPVMMDMQSSTEDHVHPSIMECMRLMMREINLPDIQREIMTQKLTARITLAQQSRK